MAISFACACGRSLRAKPELAGKKARCPQCSAVLTIPSPAPVEGTGPMSDVIGDRPAGPSPEAGYGLADDPAPAPTMRFGEPSGRPRPASPAPAPKPKAAARPAPAASASSPREFLYLAMVLAMVPLGLSMLAAPDDLEARFEQTLSRATPEVVAQIEQLSNDEGGLELEELLAALPDHRIDDNAHLDRESQVHWLYAGLAAVAFWVFTMALFPGERKTPGHLLLVGLFTGTVGIVFLLGVQFLAGATQNYWMTGRSVVVILFYLAKFIGWSYASALDPSSNFWLSVIGFTFGVGLCEELCKALPLLGYYRRDARMGWRGAAVWGLASGVGFGVAEGIMYSANYYNGISTGGIYVVRFVSCVALHAIWSASVGITLWKRQATIQGDVDWVGYSLSVIRILAVPMVLHALYDTLLKKDMDALALLTGLASFAWFAWQVESARGEAPEGRLAPA